MDHNYCWYLAAEVIQYIIMKRIVFIFAFASLFPALARAEIKLNLEYPEFGGFDLNIQQNLPQIIAFFYYFMVTIAGLAAFVMLIWGGIQWLSSAGNASQISDAKDKIQKALLGLLLILASFLVIQILNPELTVISSEPLNAGKRTAPLSGPNTSAPAGQTELGVYLCEHNNCTGRWLRATGGCLATPDLSNGAAMKASGCFTPSENDWKDSDWNGWDKRISSIGVNFENPFGVLLFDKKGSPGFDNTSRVVCFRGSVSGLGLYQLEGLGTWNDETGGFYLISDVKNACSNPGITLQSYVPDYSPSPPQPAVFLFDWLAYGDDPAFGTPRQFSIPLERWKPGAKSTGPRSDQYELPPREPAVLSVWVTDEPICGPGNDEPCAVRLWAAATTNPATDANICFRESKPDLSQYSFDCKSKSPRESIILDKILGVDVVSASSECAVEFTPDDEAVHCNP